jgi:hypothetical protein
MEDIKVDESSGIEVIQCRTGETAADTHTNTLHTPFTRNTLHTALYHNSHIRLPTTMNFYEPSNKMYTYAKPIGILPKIFWAVTIGTVGYAIADRYVVGQEEKTKWRQAVIARVSSRSFVRPFHLDLDLDENCGLIGYRSRPWIAFGTTSSRGG